MKTIGLLGGMSWESTAGYYRIINQTVRRRLGGLHSARIAMVSVDFAPLEAQQREGDWAGAADVLAQAARGIEAAGADFFLICTNTMHKVADEVAAAVDIPLLHIADATAAELTAHGVQTVGLLGTGFTMEEDFYKGWLQRVHGLDVVVPGKADRQLVHDVIYQELCRGDIRPASKRAYLRIVAEMTRAGVQGVVLGCTEIGLLIGREDTDTPLFDTTAIHAEKAVERALSGIG